MSLSWVERLRRAFDRLWGPSHPDTEATQRLRKNAWWWFRSGAKWARQQRDEPEKERKE
jgi:hypothetical protein